MTDYCVVIRLKRGGTAEYQIRALNIRDVAKEIRGKHKLWGNNPHQGFEIKECFII